MPHWIGREKIIIYDFEISYQTKKSLRMQINIHLMIKFCHCIPELLDKVSPPWFDRASCDLLLLCLPASFLMLIRILYYTPAMWNTCDSQTNCAVLPLSDLTLLCNLSLAVYHSLHFTLFIQQTFIKCLLCLSYSRRFLENTVLVMTSFHRGFEIL